MSLRMFLAIAAAAATAVPAGLVTKGLNGIQYEVSCLSKTLCVAAGYNSFSTGDVVAVRNGKPGHVSVVHKTSRVESVSCPNASGCVALADPSSGVGAEFVSIGKSGIVNGTKTAADGTDDITDISCTKLTSCEVAGVNIVSTPWKIVFGSWNGKKLRLRAISSLKHTTLTSIQDVSCAGGKCDIVGYTDSSAGITGLSLVVSGTKAGKLHTANGDSLYGVSCVSKSTCYAAGYTVSGGIAVTVKNGAIGSASKTPSDLAGIACSGAKCTAVGLENAPEGSGELQWGTIVSVAGGKVTGAVPVKQAENLNSVARIGTFYAAVGAGQPGKQPSELVTN